MMVIFFDKGNIIISQTYQLHLVSATTKNPKDITDAHNLTTKRRRKQTKDPATMTSFL
jgi:hypothetical protein